MCGGLGFLIGTIIFFSWYRSDVTWKKIVAYICGVWMTVSAAYLALLFLAYA